MRNLPGVKVVAPSDAYDAKGLLIAAIRDRDPVVYLDYGEVKGGDQPDVPDEAYEVPLGKAVGPAAGQGPDDRGVGAGDGGREAGAAGHRQGRHQRRIHRSPHDQAARRGHPGGVGAQDQAPAGRRARALHGGFGSHVIAEIVQAVPGVRVKKMAFPDAPGPGAADMMAWLRPDAPKILDAAIQMMRA